MNLAGEINRLSEIGCIHIHSHDDFTFSCGIDLFVKSKGTEFKIKSDYNHKTVNTALTQLFSRVNEAMAPVSDQKMIKGD